MHSRIKRWKEERDTVSSSWFRPDKGCSKHPRGGVRCAACLDAGLSISQRQARDTFLNRQYAQWPRKKPRVAPKSAFTVTALQEAFAARQNEYAKELSSEYLSMLENNNDMNHAVSSSRKKDMRQASAWVGYIKSTSLLALIIDVGGDAMQTETLLTGYLTISDEYSLRVIYFNDFINTYIKSKLFIAIRALLSAQPEPSWGGDERDRSGQSSFNSSHMNTLTSSFAILPGSSRPVSALRGHLSTSNTSSLTQLRQTVSSNSATFDPIFASRSSLLTLQQQQGQGGGDITSSSTARRRRRRKQEEEQDSIELFREESTPVLAIAMSRGAAGVSIISFQRQLTPLVGSKTASILSKECFCMMDPRGCKYISIPELLIWYGAKEQEALVSMQVHMKILAVYLDVYEEEEHVDDYRRDGRVRNAYADETLSVLRVTRPSSAMVRLKKQKEYKQEQQYDVDSVSELFTPQNTMMFDSGYDDDNNDDWKGLTPFNTVSDYNTQQQRSRHGAMSFLDDDEENEEGVEDYGEDLMMLNGAVQFEEDPLAASYSELYELELQQEATTTTRSNKSRSEEDKRHHLDEKKQQEDDDNDGVSVSISVPVRYHATTSTRTNNKQQQTKLSSEGGCARLRKVLVIDCDYHEDIRSAMRVEDELRVIATSLSQFGVNVNDTDSYRILSNVNSAAVAVATEEDNDDTETLRRPTRVNIERELAWLSDVESGDVCWLHYIGMGGHVIDSNEEKKRQEMQEEAVKSEKESGGDSASVGKYADEKSDKKKRRSKTKKDSGGNAEVNNDEQTKEVKKKKKKKKSNSSSSHSSMDLSAESSLLLDEKKKTEKTHSRRSHHRKDKSSSKQSSSRSSSRPSSASSSRHSKKTSPSSKHAHSHPDEGGEAGEGNSSTSSQGMLLEAYLTACAQEKNAFLFPNDFTTEGVLTDDDFYSRVIAPFLNKKDSELFIVYDACDGERTVGLRALYNSLSCQFETDYHVPKSLGNVTVLHSSRRRRQAQLDNTQQQTTTKNQLSSSSGSSSKEFLSGCVDSVGLLTCELMPRLKQGLSWTSLMSTLNEVLYVKPWQKAKTFVEGFQKASMVMLESSHCPDDDMERHDRSAFGAAFGRREQVRMISSPTYSSVNHAAAATKKKTKMSAVDTLMTTTRRRNDHEIALVAAQTQWPNYILKMESKNNNHSSNKVVKPKIVQKKTVVLQMKYPDKEISVKKAREIDEYATNGSYVWVPLIDLPSANAIQEATKLVHHRTDMKSRIPLRALVLMEARLKRERRKIHTK